MTENNYISISYLIFDMGYYDQCKMQQKRNLEIININTTKANNKKKNIARVYRCFKVLREILLAHYLHKQNCKHRWNVENYNLPKVEQKKVYLKIKEIKFYL